MSPPTDSTASAIADAVRRSVPLKSKCSRKWLAPASSSGSSREPVPTQKPMAADRKVGIASVMTRAPEDSVVRWMPGVWMPGGSVICTTAIVASSARLGGGLRVGLVGRFAGRVDG